MSKLIDKLRKTSQGEVHRMGFGGAQGAEPKVPALAIVGSVPRPDADLVKAAATTGVDVLLVEATSLPNEPGGLENILQLAGEIPCGFKLENVVPSDIDRLASAGADFAALHTEIAPSALLRAEGIGKVAVIDQYLDDSLLRTIDRLAIDAVIIELEQGNEQFLTVREVMACRRAVDLVRKPVMLRVSTNLSGSDLANIRDLGIESVLVELGGSVDALSQMRKAIDELPPRRRSREGLDVVLPQPRALPKPEPEDDEL